MSNLAQVICRFAPPLAWASVLTVGWASGAHAQAVAMTDDASPLQEVVVTGQRQHYRGDVAIEDLPQAVQVISAEMLHEIGAVRLNDALDLAAGVARQNTYGGVWDSFAIRGFAGDPNVPSGYLVNGFNSGRGFGGLRDTSSVERIEVLKGPGSALFGRGEPGGTVAITTKKPQFHTAGSVSVASGSERFRRVQGDSVQGFRHPRATADVRRRSEVPGRASRRNRRRFLSARLHTGQAARLL